MKHLGRWISNQEWIVDKEETEEDKGGEEPDS